MGDTRKIDFIFISACFQGVCGKAVDQINFGSDHRAVQAKFWIHAFRHYVNTKKSTRKKWRPIEDDNVRRVYLDVLDTKVDENSDYALNELGKILLEAAHTEGVQVPMEAQKKPWQSAELQRLIGERRIALTVMQRRRISKVIQKETRRELRRWHTIQAEKVLGEFKDLDRLHGIYKTPIFDTKQNKGPDCEEFAFLLKQVYTSDLPDLQIDPNVMRSISHFTCSELGDALRHMANGRGMDSNGIVVEMVKDASDRFKLKLLDVFNHILSNGIIQADWHTTLFSMLPKSGNLDDPANWRPIAILPIFYKIFSRLLYHRLRLFLEPEQSDDQYGFRRNKRIEDVFCVLENVIGKGIEFGVPIWMVSLDMRKAFDRIEFVPLFHALREQGVPESHIALLTSLYTNQVGSVNGSQYFKINRGVKQGDVISAMLFNAGLECAFRRWKIRLHDHGILLASDIERLSNLRYADDMMIFAKSAEELVQMMEWLVEELSFIGLELNTSKTKVLCTLNNVEDFLDIGGNFVEVLSGNKCHKYLGRHLSGDLKNRGIVECKHRIQVAWYNFHKHQKVLTNGNISMKLRLKLFEATVTPCLLFGMSVLPIYQSMMDKIDATRRKMLRKIVGWVRVDDEDWSITMSRMSERVKRALVHCPNSRDWSTRIFLMQWQYACRVRSLPRNSWVSLACRWRPDRVIDLSLNVLPHRQRGG